LLLLPCVSVFQGSGFLFYFLFHFIAYDKVVFALPRFVMEDCDENFGEDESGGGG
jgi:hypothetical protein